MRQLTNTPPVVFTATKPRSSLSMTRWALLLMEAMPIMRANNNNFFIAIFDVVFFYELLLDLLGPSAVNGIALAGLFNDDMSVLEQFPWAGKRGGRDRDA